MGEAWSGRMYEVEEAERTYKSHQTNNHSIYHSFLFCVSLARLEGCVTSRTQHQGR